MTTESQRRVLPAHPSLDHLRKEAKHMLGILRARANAAQLTDAQLIVARAYGFSSWRALKLEVDQRRQAPSRRLPAIMAEAWPGGRPGTRARTLDSSHGEQTFFALCALVFGVPNTAFVLALFLDLVLKIPH
jgi:hypothetical protein